MPRRNTSSANVTLQNAKRAKKDEFYTQLADIENELRHYHRARFQGKVVYCNCDDPCESKFVEYFVRNFNALGLKELIATVFTGSPVSGTQLPLFDTETNDQIGTGEAHVLRVKRVKNSDLDDVGSFAELLKKRLRKAKKLNGTGDFRSPECVALLKEADIVVTNPPFSLFREYVAQLVEYRKKFLIIGNKNAITYKDVFVLIKNNTLWTGYRNFSGGMWFISDYEGKYEKTVNGVKIINVPAIWLTNLDHSKRHERLQLYKNYTAEAYPQYDNYDAIEVSKTAEIPCDYYGAMGVPITFLDKYNPEQFEILGIDRYIEGNQTPNKRFMISGTEIYARIIIKRKDTTQ
ncbi:MAG: adenine-specific methyltransferase EcoRI family protein [Puniceicoccales bacterium]|jgi:hypothetical protein|nr:adenine-specific methyltransferase EcoRI family protein [Puniceicoccales bacterium]